MAWETCEWCQKNINGRYAADRHRKSEHPADYRVWQAETRANSTRLNIDRYEADLAEHRVFREYIETHDMPDVVRKTLESQRDQCSWMTRHGMSIEATLVLLIKGRYEALAEYEAELAAARDNLSEVTA